MSLMTSLSTGVSGLKAAQTAVNTTAHNIANVNTKGYSRQDIINADKVYNKVGSSHISYSQVGLGSEVAAIKQPIHFCCVHKISIVSWNLIR